jgi:hypothetical protein
LISNSDWVDEEVRMSPLLASDVAAWLQTPAVTGLESVAEIVAASDGTTVQIASQTPGTAGSVEVEGGISNTASAAVFGSSTLNFRGGPTLGDTLIATIRRSESDGLIGNRWVRIDNEKAQPKAAFLAAGNHVTSIASSGRWEFSVAPYLIIGEAHEVRVVVERFGNFVAIHIPNNINGDIGAYKQALNLNQAVEYGYVYLTTDTNSSDLPDISLANRGVFRVVRFTGNADGNTLWIENGNAVDETSVCRIKALSADSSIPGDTWAVSTSDFGAGNKGTWIVGEVGATTPGGEQFVDDSFVVQAQGTTSSPHGDVFVTSTNLAGLQLRQGVPSRLFKQVLSIAPNQDDALMADIQLSSGAGYQDVGAAAGSVLLNEVNRIVYGDPAAPSSYPGYAAAGASVLPSGPTVKRVKLALSLRVASGLASEDLADRVRSAVAAVINQAGVGEAVAISDVVAAAGRVGGVIAVAVISPTYSSTSDTIKVGGGEKLLVLDLRADVMVSFVGA